MSAEYNGGLKQVSINGFESKIYIQVLFNNGRLYGWGNNEYGQLTGNCVTFNKITRPMPILGLVNTAPDDSLVKEQTINDLKSEIEKLKLNSNSFNPALYYPKTESYNRSEIDTKLNLKANQSDMVQQFNSTNSNVTNLIRQVNEVKTNYYTKSQSEAFVKQILQNNYNNLVFSNRMYVSAPFVNPAYTNEISLNIQKDGKTFNNFEITFTSGVLKLSNPTVGQSGIIKINNAKMIGGYDIGLRPTTPLPVLDKLNVTEYFAYFVFGTNEILLSRI